MSLLIEQLVPAAVKTTAPELKIWQAKAFELERFDGRTTAFFQALSRRLMKNPSLNRLPAVAALAFWLREANMKNIEKAAASERDAFRFEPLGTVFHICPANVDTMFLYSLAVSLLCGNRNVLRLSPALRTTFLPLIFDEMNALLALPEHEIIGQFLCLVSYERHEETNRFFSLRADARIIWGGDETVRTFKKLETKPRVRDFYFADRRSMVVFDSAAFLALDEKGQREAARKFFNDSYTFDQRGCSSPQVLFVKGEDVANEAFLASFCPILDEIASKSYETDLASLASLKLNAVADDAMAGYAKRQIQQSNWATFIEIEQLDLEKETCGGGYFYFKKVRQAAEILDSVDKKVQTLSFFGLSKAEIDALADGSRGLGIDRIVPVGSALDFGPIWDGYDLLSELCSKKLIQK